MTMTYSVLQPDWSVDAVGLGEPPYFYIESVFLLNGMSMGVFFLFGLYLRSVRRLLSNDPVLYCNVKKYF